MSNMTIRGPHKSNDGNTSIFRGPLTCPCIFQESGVLPDTKSWVPGYQFVALKRQSMRLCAKEKEDENKDERNEEVRKNSL